MDNTTKEVTQQKTKKKIYKRWWFWAVVVIVIFSLASGGGNNEDANTTNTSSQDPDQTSSPAVTQDDPKPKASDIAVDIELSSGHYTVGIDLPAGKYDIEAVSGGGNVASSNAFTGGINAIMGTEEKNAETDMDLYEQKYSNIKLGNGVVLSISGVKVRLTCEKASGEPLSPRNQTITENVTLKNGNFVAGEDFPSGVYDISVVSGGGNVSSSNVFTGGINAIMGTANKNDDIGGDMYEQEYLNISLEDGVTLSIDGVEILLTPSK